MVDVDNKLELRLPGEMLLLVFQHLDPDSLLAVRQTCRAWDQLVKSSVLLWKSRVRRHFGSHPNHCALLNLPLYKDRKKSAARLQALERRLRRLDRNLQENKFKVYTIDCLEAELNGKKVVKSDEWEATHNYRGVYDMILDSNRLIASVYDTIQVWDLSTYQMTNLLNPKSLDSPGAATTCFAVLRDRLVCGTQNGQLKLIDLESGKVVSTSSKNHNYVSDVCVKGDSVVAVDWYGGLSKWQYTGAGIHSRLLEQEGQWEAPRLLGNREVERLLDFSDEYLVTTFRSHLTCYIGDKFYRSYPAHSDIFCISIVGDRVAFGCKGDRSTPVAGVLRLGEGPPQVIYMRTRDNDPVISLHLSNSYLTLGDVNGELHRLEVWNLRFPESGEVTINLGSERKNEGKEGQVVVLAEGGEEIMGTVEEASKWGISSLGTLRSHAYRDFVWAVKADTYRIFSGDETGKIFIHDFLMLEDSVGCSRSLSYCAPQLD